MSTKTNTSVNEISLKDRVIALKETSKMIRALDVEFKSDPNNKDKLSYSFVEKKLKEFGITTKNGDHIRYQHVRNVLLTPLTGKK